jgi:hypothetical protein
MAVIALYYTKYYYLVPENIFIIARKAIAITHYQNCR